MISYPWIMPATYEPCPAFPVAAGDVAYTYDIQATLNDAIRRSATETGVTFVDATTPSVGHDSCKPVGTRWIEPILTTQQIVPVHPNALGERELARSLPLRWVWGAEGHTTRIAAHVARTMVRAAPGAPTSVRTAPSCMACASMTASSTTGDRFAATE